MGLPGVVGPVRRVAMLSVHTSPLAQPGSGDAGGMNVYIDAVARRMARRGIAVDVFTRATTSSLPPVVEVEDGYRVRHVLAGPLDGLTKEELPAQLCPFAANVLRAATPGGFGPRYDVVHSHYWLSGQVGYLVRDRWGIPLVHSAHTLAKVKNAALAGDGDAPEPRSRVIGEEQIAAEADLLVAATDVEAAQWVSLYGADTDRVAVVHPGVDVQRFAPFGVNGAWNGRVNGSANGRVNGGVNGVAAPGVAGALNGTLHGSLHGPLNGALGPAHGVADETVTGHRCPAPAVDVAARERLGLAPTDVVVAFAGRIQPHKGPDVLVRALAELVARDPGRPFTAVIAGDPSGSGHRLREGLVALAAELGVAERLRMLPALAPERLVDLYRAADVVVVPSHSESFGLVALEAQACGTPVVAARVGGLPVAVVDGRTGLLVDGHAAADWADALAAVALDRSRRARMAVAARAHAETLSWDVTVDRLLGAYRSAALGAAIPIEAGA